MSTPLKCKRTRKRAHNKKKENFTDKFKRFKPKYLQNLLWEGYYRELKRNTNLKLALDIENVTRLYLPILTPKEEINMNRLAQSVYNRENKTLTLGEKFNALWSNQRKLLCYRIIQGKNKTTHVRKKPNELSLETIKVTKADDTSIYELMLFIEYILLKCKKIKKLDLSNMSLNDTHIVWLCNTIENIIKHWNKHNKLRQNKINMKLTVINLSSNKNITDKQLNLLLRTIKKHAPKMQSLRLVDSNITNKSISTIMKYRIKTMAIYLDGCKGITVEELEKYPKIKHSDSSYCANLIHYKRNSDVGKTMEQTKKIELQKVFTHHDKPYGEAYNDMRWKRSDW